MLKVAKKGVVQLNDVVHDDEKNGYHECHIDGWFDGDWRFDAL